MTEDTWGNLRRVDFKAGDILFKEGDQGFFFYILQDGKVEVYKEEEGQRKTLNVVESGQPLGEFALITESLRSASARALTDGYAVEVSEEGYKKLIDELPQWAVAILQSLVRRLKEANDMLTQQGGSHALFDEITQRIRD